MVAPSGSPGGVAASGGYRVPVATRPITFTLERAGVTVDWTWTMETPVNEQVAYMRAFFVFRGWQIRGVTPP